MLFTLYEDAIENSVAPIMLNDYTCYSLFVELHGFQVY